MKKIIFFTIIALLLVSISITSVSAQNQYEIPSWVKGVAGFWAEGKISDADFGEGLSFLINSEIIKVPKIQELQDKINQLQSENADLRSKLNLPESDVVSDPKECGDNQIEQNGVCRDITCGPNQIWQNNKCQDVVTGSKNNLNLQTNKVLYGQSDIIVITGLIHNIENFSTTLDVAIIVRAPDNNIVTIIQVHPNADGSFQTRLKADGPQFIASGDYKVFANFSGLKSEIKFKFTGGDGGIVSDGETPITCPSGQTLVNGKCISITISVTTDKSKYSEDDTIMVTGRVTSILVGTPISLIVTNPNGDRVILDQLYVDLYGKFSTEFTIGGPLMRDSGTYTIKVIYGSEERTAQTAFTFSGSSVIPASHGVTTINFEKNYYNNDEKFIFVGKESNGDTSVFIIIRDSTGNFMGMLSDPSSDSDGTFSTLPRDVSQFFKSKGTYVATAFTDEQKEENGISIIIQYDGIKITQ